MTEIILDTQMTTSSSSAMLLALTLA